jgi:hypothetical protein
MEFSESTGSRMASTMASAKSCPRAIAAKGLCLATPEGSALLLYPRVEFYQTWRRTEPRRITEKERPQENPRRGATEIVP